MACVVRAVYQFEMADSVWFDVLLGDSATYHRQATQLAAGEALPQEAYWQAPLYSHALAFLYRFTGPRPEIVRFVQALLGAWTCVWLARAASRTFDARVGLLSGLALAFWGPSLFFEGLLQKTALVLFLFAWALDALTQLGETGRTRSAALAGLLFGALALLRENTLLLVPVVALWIVRWMGTREPEPDRSPRRRLALVFALAAALPPFAVVLRNRAVAGEFVLTTNAGVNLFIGNNAHADGLYRPLVVGRGDPLFEAEDAARLASEREGRELSPGEVSSTFASEALGWMASHPLAAMDLFVQKLRLCLTDREWMDSQSIEVHAEDSWVLAVLSRLGRFRFLLPLAIVGIVLGLSQRRRFALWLASIPALLVAVSIFFVFARFRHPLVLLLLPFAVEGVRRWVGDMRAANYSRVYLGAAAAMTGVFLALGPSRVREFPQADTWNNLGSALLRRGEQVRALEAFQRASAAQPSYSAPLFNQGRLYVQLGDFERALDPLQHASFREPRYALEAELLLVEAEWALGREIPARVRWDRALGRAENAAALPAARPEDWTQLGVLARRLGDPARAEECHRQALRLAPNHAEAHNNLGFLLDLEGRGAEALRHYTAALAADPNLQEALVNLAWLRTAHEDPALRDPVSAVALARRARAADPAAWNWMELEAAALAAAGRTDEARPLFEAALEAAPEAEHPGLLDRGQYYGLR